MNEAITEIINYIADEETYLMEMEELQTNISLGAHELEETADTNYKERKHYINNVFKMKKIRAGITAHYQYVMELHRRHNEMAVKISHLPK